MVAGDTTEADERMKKMLWPRIVYWISFTMMALGLFYALTGINTELGLVHKSDTQTGGAAFALLGVLAMMGGKAWMDAVVRWRCRVNCASCNRLVQATLPHCAHCGAPQRTTTSMLRALADTRPLARSQPTFCSACGSESALGAGFCRSCGRAQIPTNDMAAAL
jgi:hypothetical protein